MRQGDHSRDQRRSGPADDDIEAIVGKEVTTEENGMGMPGRGKILARWVFA